MYPLPCDRPEIVTPINPACLCGHAQHVHDYAGDQFVPAWGVCEVKGCDCRTFRDVAYGKEA